MVVETPYCKKPAACKSVRKEERATKNKKIKALVLPLIRIFPPSRWHQYTSLVQHRWISTSTKREVNSETM